MVSASNKTLVESTNPVQVMFDDAYVKDKATGHMQVHDTKGSRVTQRGSTSVHPAVMGTSWNEKLILYEWLQLQKMR